MTLKLGMTWLLQTRSQYVGNVPTMKNGMSRLLLWVLAQASFDDMLSKGLNILSCYSFIKNSEQLQKNQRNAMNIFKTHGKNGRMTHETTFQQILLSLHISAACWELGETIPWSSKTSRMKLRVDCWVIALVKRERTDRMDGRGWLYIAGRYNLRLQTTPKLMGIMFSQSGVKRHNMMQHSSFARMVFLMSK